MCKDNLICNMFIYVQTIKSKLGLQFLFSWFFFKMNVPIFCRYLYSPPGRGTCTGRMSDPPDPSPPSVSAPARRPRCRPRHRGSRSTRAPSPGPRPRWRSLPRSSGSHRGRCLHSGNLQDYSEDSGKIIIKWK